MKRIEVFDPPMCCSSGVCGPNVNTELAEFQGNLALLKNHGVEVRRFNLGHEPEPFIRRPVIVESMGASGEHLPIILVDEVIVSKGRYPSREELLGWTGVELAPDEAASARRLKVME